MVIRNLTAALCIVVVGCSFAAGSAKSDKGRGQAIDLIAEGQSFEEQGKMSDAVQCFYQSANLAPSPAAFYHLGAIYAKTGDRETARNYLSQALQLNPNFELAKVELMNLDQKKASAKHSKTELASYSPLEQAAAAAGPVNVDNLQREYQTIHSLQKPVGLADSSPQIAQAGGMIPPAPQNAGTGSLPPVPAAPQNPSSPGAARKAMEPNQPHMISNDSPATLISNEDANNGKSKFAATSQIAATKQPVPAAKSLVPGATPAPPSVAEINAAAFGPEAKLQTPSIGYGNTTKVAVGTYAFHRERGDSYAVAYRWKDAADEYKMALELNPQDTEVRALMAEALEQAGDTAASKEQFARAKDINPDDPMVYYKQGNAYRDEQKPDLAIGSYRRAISLDSNNKFAHNNLGVVYMEKGDYSHAVAEFKKVVDIDPSYDKAILNLGIIYDDHLADKAEALKYYDMYLKKNGERSAEVTKWANAIRTPAQAPAQP